MITIQIRDEDLELLHFDLSEHCWNSDVVSLNNASYNINSPDTLVCNAVDIVGISDFDTYVFSNWIGENLLIKETVKCYEITDASYNAGVLTLKIDLDGDDYIFADSKTDIKCQVYGYTDVILDAFNTLKEDLLDRGFTLDSLSATSSFRDAQRYKTLERVFKQITNDVTEDKWGKLALEYERKYLNELTTTNIASDATINNLGVRIQL